MLAMDLYIVGIEDSFSMEPHPEPTELVLQYIYIDTIRLKNHIGEP